MDTATRNRLTRFRENVLRPVAAREAAAAAEPPEPKDTRPRYAAGPLVGQLRDRRARMEEELGLDGPADEVNEWLPQALELPAWREAYQKYERLYGDAVGAEQIAARAAAGMAADIEATARYLGLTVEELKSKQADPAGVKELALREHNAQVRDQIAALETSLRPIPEPEAPAQ